MKSEKLWYCFPLRFKSFGGCIAMKIKCRGITLWVSSLLGLLMRTADSSTGIADSQVRIHSHPTEKNLNFAEQYTARQ